MGVTAILAMFEAHNSAQGNVPCSSRSKIADSE
jgi:hypothetical protein